VYDNIMLNLNLAIEQTFIKSIERNKSINTINW